MSVRQIKAGSTDVSVNIRIIDSTDGTPETGVVYDTSGIDLWYRRELAASVDITEATLAALTTAHTDGGFLHINDGWYRLDLPDAAVADGVTGVQIGGTVTGMVVLAPYIELVDYDPYDGVRLGLTALPDAAADAAGGLPISDLGGLDLDAMNTNINDIETDTADMQPKLGTITNLGSGATLGANLVDIEAQTDDIGAAGAGLTAIPYNTAWDADIESEVTDALNAYDPPTRAELTSDINSLNDPTAATIADAVWDELATGHTEAGKAGEQLWTDVDAILADTNELQVDDVPGLIAGLNDLSQTQVTGGAYALDTDVNGRIRIVDGTAAGELDTDAGTVLLRAATETQIDNIESDTNELQLDDVPGLIGALNDLSAAQVNAEVDTAFTTQMADSVSTDGTIATREQALYMILQTLQEFAISGTTLTVKKVDGSTTLMTFTLDDGTNPTSLTRAS
jgi:hypothetical protein